MNRRKFLNYFGVYIAATSVTCLTCRSAYAWLNDIKQESDNSPSWVGNTAQPSINQQSQQPSHSNFKLEGCSLSGDFASQFRFIRSSGIPQIDQAVFGEANNLSQVTGMQPSLAFLDDRDSKNAFAIKQDIISGRSQHGAIAMGVMLIKDLLELQTLNQQNNALCIQAVLVHEWAHIAQFNYGIQASRIKYTELMADFIAGWYLGYKDAFVGSQSDATSPMIGMASIGDTNFNSPGHHGTPRERLGAYVAGIKFVKAGGGGGMGGGIQGGFFSGANNFYGNNGFGGGMGGRTQPPDFRAALEYATRKYIR